MHIKIIIICIWIIIMGHQSVWLPIKLIMVGIIILRRLLALFFLLICAAMFFHHQPSIPRSEAMLIINKPEMEEDWSIGSVTSMTSALHYDQSPRRSLFQTSALLISSTSVFLCSLMLSLLVSRFRYKDNDCYDIKNWTIPCQSNSTVVVAQLIYSTASV